MNEELQHLWSLRDLDERTATLNGSLARFPEERREIEAKVTAERARLDAVKSRVAELQKTRRAREREIDAVREEERKFQSQLPAVRKNEEYTALLHEIEAAKNRRSDMETEVLMQLEEEERVHNDRPVLEASLATIEREAAERRVALDREEEEHRAQLATLEQQRALHLERLGGGTRQRYERVHRSREGRAVVPILKGACGGCYRNQPPQVLQTARRGDRVLVCDGCARLMIWPPEGP